VIDHLENRLLEPRRLQAMMTNIIDRRSIWAEQRHKPVGDLRKRVTAQRVEIHSLTSMTISGCRVELFRTLAATGGVKEAVLAVSTRVPG
jgi:hypothetical protein